MSINDQIQTLCRENGISLHCTASADRVDWHAIQIESREGIKYEQRIRNSAGHSTAELAIAATLAMPWGEWAEPEGCK